MVVEKEKTKKDESVCMTERELYLNDSGLGRTERRIAECAGEADRIRLERDLVACARLRMCRI